MVARATTQRPPVVETEGRRQFQRALEAEALKAEGLSRSAIAEKIGRSIQSLWAYANRTRRPDEETRKAIEIAFGIEADLWLTAAEKRERARRKAWLDRQSAA